MARYNLRMSNAPPIDLSAIPESQRAAVLALLQENGALKDANRRLEHLVAELNHVVHGKRSEKLSDDDRQLAFEDLETAVAEVETRKEQAAPSTTTPRQSSRLRRCGQSGAPVLGTKATARAMPNTITNNDEENLVIACTGTWPQSGNWSYGSRPLVP